MAISIVCLLILLIGLFVFNYPGSVLVAVGVGALFFAALSVWNGKVAVDKPGAWFFSIDLKNSIGLLVLFFLLFTGIFLIALGFNLI
ncbi:MAG: hypothetical protein NUV67_04310 [archaeon]|nr:hypothetical protein [archaeon]